MPELLSEELAQELLIVKWKNPELDENSTKEKAVRNILFSEYHFYKHHRKLKRLSKKIEHKPVQEIISGSIGLFLVKPNDPVLAKLSSYERYIVYLLTTNTKGEVSKLLNCSPSYMSKLLDSIKTKLLKE